MGDRTNIADARQHDAEQAAGVIEQAMRNEGLFDKDVRLMGEIITEALDAAGFDVVLRADPDTSDGWSAQPQSATLVTEQPDGSVTRSQVQRVSLREVYDPDTSDDLFTEARRLLDAATPGPWGPTCYRGTGLGWDVEAPEAGIRGQFENEADAELIAAAPRLIAALLERAVTAEADRGEAERRERTAVNLANYHRDVARTAGG
ncbi:MAG: hypothetical protein KTQ12_08860, partial [Dermatophilaceae bacterium]|nr:hypothetical protein [Dermatophilaceae bacterium]